MLGIICEGLKDVINTQSIFRCIHSLVAVGSDWQWKKRESCNYCCQWQ